MSFSFLKMEQKCVANGPVEGELDDMGDTGGEPDDTGDTGALHAYSVTLSSVFLPRFNFALVFSALQLCLLSCSDSVAEPSRSNTFISSSPSCLHFPGGGKQACLLPSRLQGDRELKRDPERRYSFYFW